MMVKIKVACCVFRERLVLIILLCNDLVYTYVVGSELAKVVLVIDFTLGIGVLSMAII